MIGTIGTIIKMEREIEVITRGKKVKIGANDEAVINKDGDLYLISGKAMGSTLYLNHNSDEYNTTDIARLIVEDLGYFNIDNILENNDIDKIEFIERVEMTLDKIF